MGDENRSTRRAADAYGKTQKPSQPAPVNRNATDKDQPAFEKVGPDPGIDPSTTTEAFGTTTSGAERVAHLLIAMGPDRASEVLGRLEPPEIEMVAKAIIQTPSVRRDEAERLLKQLRQFAVF